MSTEVRAPGLRQQEVSVTRQMASAFPQLKALAEQKGLQLHHLGAGYPHPEVSDPTAYIAQKEAYFRHLAEQGEGEADETMRQLLTGVYSYTDTLGPKATREAFAKVYGRDFGFEIDPDLLVPTMGATGGIALMCSLFERTGEEVAYIVDAPSYTGFLSRAALYQKARFYSIDLADEEGPAPEALRGQIQAARDDGHQVAFYYTVPDGHNPGGISFSQSRREALMEVAREEGIFIVEDAPYTYISFEDTDSRPQPFAAIDASHTVHLFTASKLGLPGPRVGYLYSDGDLVINADKTAPLKDLLVTEAAATILFHNPEALRGFEAYLMDDSFSLRDSLWPLAEKKNALYRDNRQLLLDGLEQYLGEYDHVFRWTKPGAGFFSVFTIANERVRTNQEFVAELIANHGVVTIPMFGFFPADAKRRNPEAGLDQLRLSFSFNESFGEQRRQDLRAAVRAFAHAMRQICGLPPIAD